MKNLILLIALFMTTSLFSQTELFSYSLDAGEKIKEIEVIAYSCNDEVAIGNIEGIKGSILTMQIAENTEYVLYINSRTIIIEAMTKEQIELAQLENLNEEITLANNH